MRVDVVGADPGDHTLINGLWPADHGGLAAGVRSQLVFAR